MEANNLTIIPPEGMEAYQEGNEIKFRPIKKVDTLQEIYKHLFYNKNAWRIDLYGGIDKYATTSTCNLSTNCTSKKQAEKLRAINKLMNVAKYLNGDWKPNWDYYTSKYYIFIDKVNNNISISYNDSYCGHYIYFKSKELAKQAIDILGEETIRLALSTDW